MIAERQKELTKNELVAQGMQELVEKEFKKLLVRENEKNSPAARPSRSPDKLVPLSHGEGVILNPLSLGQPAAATLGREVAATAALDERRQQASSTGSHKEGKAPQAVAAGSVQLDDSLIKAAVDMGFARGQVLEALYVLNQESKGQKKPNHNDLIDKVMEMQAQKEPGAGEHRA